ncbi:MAG: hypothetical protein HRT93_02945 [Piscirickettsiaceae bacterium]|nr:hypothetical protein [Piscirickettsiaceae bacterium]
MIVGTFGVDLELLVKANLVGSTSAKMIIVAPNKKRTEGTSTVTNNSDGVVTYVTEKGVFNVVGDYEIQAWVYFGTTKLLKSKAVILEVTESL